MTSSECGQRPGRHGQLVPLDERRRVGVQHLDGPLDEPDGGGALVLERADERQEVGELAGRPALGQWLVPADVTSFSGEPDYAGLVRMERDTHPMSPRINQHKQISRG